jgi:hypothetical protein
MDCVCVPIRGVANCGQDGRTCRLLHQAGISVLLGILQFFPSLPILFVVCNRYLTIFKVYSLAFSLSSLYPLPLAS